MTSMSEYKIVVMGPGRAGKSALILRYVCDEFPEEHDPTIEDTYQLTYLVGPSVQDGVNVTLEITDTSGQKQFRSMEDGWIQSGQGFILLYDIAVNLDTQKKYIEDLVTKIRRQEKLPILLVGNKADLAPELRKVSTHDAETMARILGCKVLETSAKNGSNVARAFETMVKLIAEAQSLTTTTITTTTASTTTSPTLAENYMAKPIAEAQSPTTTTSTTTLRTVAQLKEIFENRISIK